MSNLNERKSNNLSVYLPEDAKAFLNVLCRQYGLKQGEVVAQLLTLFANLPAHQPVKFTLPRPEITTESMQLTRKNKPVNDLSDWDD